MKEEIIKNQFVLIKGDFIPDEALEIINHLLVEKVNFHKGRSFSSELRFGFKDKASLLRIEELNFCRNGLLNMINVAKKNGKILKIDSTIIIQIV
jgi:hypothetical protein